MTKNVPHYEPPDNRGIGRSTTRCRPASCKLPVQEPPPAVQLRETASSARPGGFDLVVVAAHAAACATRRFRSARAPRRARSAGRGRPGEIASADPRARSTSRPAAAGGGSKYKGRSPATRLDGGSFERGRLAAGGACQTGQRFVLAGELRLRGGQQPGTHHGVRSQPIAQPIDQRGQLPRRLAARRPAARRRTSPAGEIPADRPPTPARTPRPPARRNRSRSSFSRTSSPTCRGAALGRYKPTMKRSAAPCSCRNGTPTATCRNACGPAPGTRGPISSSRDQLDRLAPCASDARTACSKRQRLRRRAGHDRLGRGAGGPIEPIQNQRAEPR